MNQSKVVGFLRSNRKVLQLEVYKTNLNGNNETMCPTKCTLVYGSKVNLELHSEVTSFNLFIGYRKVLEIFLALIKFSILPPFIFQSVDNLLDNSFLDNRSIMTGFEIGLPALTIS